jgi:hypothetical protein
MLVASPSRHVLLLVSQDITMGTFMGGNRSGFTVATPLKSSLLSSPSGVAWDEKAEAVLVSDSGNCVVRVFDILRSSGKHSVIGHPASRSIKDGSLDKASFALPSCIRSRSGRTVLVDGSVAIREIDFAGKAVRTLHASERKIHSVSLDNDGQVYFLEDI